jgi:tRNA (mo5U34)-methyltransferase
MTWNREEILTEIERLQPWYHKVDLGNGVVTPGYDWDDLWDNIRQVRACIDYHGKAVLDLGSYDGMWAFEAETLGAETVVATDCFTRPYRNLLFCREVLQSRVIPYYNISPYKLTDRLDVFRQETRQAKFDIVQHLGLLYHLRDPLLTLSQVRSVLNIGGHLLLETAAIANIDTACMIFNGVPPQKTYEKGDGYWWRGYNDVTTWWLPTVSCLKEVLRATLFQPLMDTVHIVKQPPTYEMRGTQKTQYERSRVCMLAVAVAPDQASQALVDELARTYRNPGLEL